MSHLLAKCNNLKEATRHCIFFFEDNRFEIFYVSFYIRIYFFHNQGKYR